MPHLKAAFSGVQIIVLTKGIIAEPYFILKGYTKPQFIAALLQSPCKFVLSKLLVHPDKSKIKVQFALSHSILCLVIPLTVIFRMFSCW